MAGSYGRERSRRGSQQGDLARRRADIGSAAFWQSRGLRATRWPCRQRAAAMRLTSGPTRTTNPGGAALALSAPVPRQPPYHKRSGDVAIDDKVFVVRRDGARAVNAVDEHAGGLCHAGLDVVAPPADTLEAGSGSAEAGVTEKGDISCFMYDRSKLPLGFSAEMRRF